MSGISSNFSSGITISNTNDVTNQMLFNSKEAMNQSLLDLVPGDTFKGQVLDIKQDSVTIQIGNQLIEGKLEQDVALTIHQTIEFLVKENEGNKVVISPNLNHVLEGTDVALYQALEQAGLSATDKNIDTIMELLKNQMSLDKGTIQKTLAFSYQYPDVDLKDLVLMMKYNIPITKESIEQWQNYKESNHQVTNQLQSIIKELPSFINNILLNEGNEKGYAILNDFFQNSMFDCVRNELDSLLTKYKNSELSAQDISKLLTEKMSLNGETSKSILEKASDDFLQQISLKPEQLDQEMIAKQLEQIEKQVNILHDKVGNLGNEKEALLQSTKELKNNLDFMKNLNQNFIYTQLPLQLSKQITHSDLYVFANRNMKKASKDGIRLLLHLDMEYLGSTDILIAMQGTNINLDFTFTNQDSVDITKSHVEELNQHLNKKGFQVISSFAVKEDETDFDFINDFICQDNEAESVTRYSFDMRA